MDGHTQIISTVVLENEMCHTGRCQKYGVNEQRVIRKLKLITLKARITDHTVYLGLTVHSELTQLNLMRKLTRYESHDQTELRLINKLRPTVSSGM